MSNYRIALDSYWLCNSNLVESSMIYNFLLENGHKLTTDPSKADFIIISTCGVTNYMHNHYRTLIRKYLSIKKKDAQLIVYGCMVKIAPEKLNLKDIDLISFDDRHKFNDLFYKKKKIEEIPLICDDKTYRKLIEMKKILYRKCFGNEKITSFSWTLQFFLFPKIFSFFSKRIKIKYGRFARLLLHKNKIFIQISRGCNYNCSYCAIKRAKGNPVSIATEDIIKNIRKIYHPSKTLVLVADDCAMYGVDTNSNLIKLIYEINKSFPGCKFDLSFIHPRYIQRFPDELINLFKNVNIESVQIPLQSGSNRILKKMRRYYDVKKVLKIIEKIKKTSPQTLFLAHFIIGHPGETTRDFIKTLKSSKYFDFSYPIPYSDMERTHSFQLPNKKTIFTINIRFYFSILFMSFVLLYKLYQDDFLKDELEK